MLLTECICTYTQALANACLRLCVCVCIFVRAYVCVCVRVCVLQRVNHLGPRHREWCKPLQLPATRRTTLVRSHVYLRKGIERERERQRNRERERERDCTILALNIVNGVISLRLLSSWFCCHFLVCLSYVHTCIAVSYSVVQCVAVRVQCVAVWSCIVIS